MSEPWPWFVGALALAAVAVLYTAVTKRAFGVSGHVGRIVGDASGRRLAVLFLGGIAAGAFVSALSAGAFAGFDVARAFSVDAAYARFFGGGAGAWAALFAGGVLVGAGTAIAGGCTSGHGLVGCARLQPGSLASTACFMAAAVAVSFALGRLA